MADFLPVRRRTLAVLASFILLGSSAPLLAQSAPPARMRGTIEAVDGKVLTIQPRDGASLKVKLADKARITALIKASLTDVKPGTFVGITSMPDADGNQKALEIHIFPEAMRGTGEGQRPWDLGPQSKMTNGNVKLRVGAVSGEDLTLDFKGGAAKIKATPETTIVAFAEAKPDDLKPGNKVILFGLKKDSDGMLEAGFLSVGRDGLTPPM